MPAGTSQISARYALQSGIWWDFVAKNSAFFVEEWG
jgi:hypothetical protein